MTMPCKDISLIAHSELFHLNAAFPLPTDLELKLLPIPQGNHTKDTIQRPTRSLLLTEKSDGMTEAIAVISSFDSHLPIDVDHVDARFGGQS